MLGSLLPIAFVLSLLDLSLFAAASSLAFFFAFLEGLSDLDLDLVLLLGVSESDESDGRKEGVGGGADVGRSVTLCGLSIRNETKRNIFRYRSMTKA